MFSASQKFGMAFAILLLFTTLGIAASFSIAVTAISIFSFVVMCWHLKADYLNPAVAFLLPWLLLFLFVNLPVSAYSRELHPKTFMVLFFSQAACLLAVFWDQKPNPKPADHQPEVKIFKLGYQVAVLLFIALAVANVIAAGYVPLLRGLATGDTGYLNFGVKSVYGFYNAYANALAIFSYYLYLKLGKRSFLAVYFAVFIVFILFVTRAYMISMIVETVVVHSLTRRRIARKRIAIWATAILFLFGVIGEFRTGDIREIAGIKDAYQKVPSMFVWLYSYNYFNVLNIDNVVSSSSTPYYDGSSFYQFIPSIMRPSNREGDLLELSNFNVGSYLLPTYMDGGVIEVFLLTIIMMYLSLRCYRKASSERSFLSSSIFSVLYFCALFSFFWNFWFYLPIVFQIPIFWMLDRWVIRVPHTQTP